jgi:hypothetical protein
VRIGATEFIAFALSTALVNTQPGLGPTIRAHTIFGDEHYRIPATDILVQAPDAESVTPAAIDRKAAAHPGGSEHPEFRFGLT